MHPGSGKSSRKELLLQTIGALGVVFGDIGTSPLYAIQACFDPVYGLAPSTENIMGILSLVFWSLMLVVALKYLTFILRADNKGEGGIMALIALLTPRFKNGTHRNAGLILYMGLFGAALLYGDGVITPAISVLSAIEGLRVATPAFQPLVVPLTIGILIALFQAQKRGTAQIASIFGPLTLLWFLTITVIGIPWIIKQPAILNAINPAYALEFFWLNKAKGFFVLSAVVLCITGAEALYADMGHFGRRPIRFGWFAIVMPALLINYFGQGALILDQGSQVLHNPFYSLVSGWLLYPLVMISTAATVIASQALISGAYSLTQQAVQLGYLPRVTITHTSRNAEGQIYVPRINQVLMLACIGLVLGFKESSELAAAYGIAVTGTMAMTSILFYSVTRTLWKWPLAVAVPVLAIFLALDLGFFTANIMKIHHGGWIPILIALVVFSVMTTWKRGREALSHSMIALAVPLGQFVANIGKIKPPRVKGTAVFMTLTQDIAPSVLLHHFKHNQVLHEKVILLSVITLNDPDVECSQRVRVTELDQGLVKVVARYGYIETPDITEILTLCEGAGLVLDSKSLSFYLGRETFLAAGQSGMANWRKRLFILLSRNARPATEFFKIPPDQVIEIGSQIRI